MNEPLNPSPIIPAAMVMQIFIVIIFSLGAYPLDYSERQKPFWERPLLSQAWLIVLFAIITLVLLLSSDIFAHYWLGFSAPFLISLVRSQTAITCVFLADIVWTFVLVMKTGGSQRSAFTSIYFTIPGLAFFLRESPSKVMLYVILISVCFSIGLIYWKAPPDAGEEQTNDRMPFWIVSMLCLLLSLSIGFLTRPH
jgi:hypothetical protein